MRRSGGRLDRREKPARLFPDGRRAAPSGTRKWGNYAPEKPAKYAYLPCLDVTGQFDRPCANLPQGFQSAEASGTVGMADVVA